VKTSSTPPLLLAGLLLLLAACEPADYRRLQGETMGTYYAVSAAPHSACDITQQQLDRELAAINAVMSTYLTDSELSKFNAAGAGEWHTMSPSLATVMDAAMALWQRSGGAFDVTVGPLVNLWGFGPQRAGEPPTGAEQSAARAAVGTQLIQLQQQDSVARLAKSAPGVYVDLSALAKGYAVDVLAESYLAAGCSDFMVDIGGEIRAAGRSPRGGPWRIGIEVPDSNALGVSQAVVTLRDVSIATSGDYRNFRMVDGRRVDHVIDPRSGQPADNHVVSATVVHPSAMWADAYATALMVMGMEQGLAFAEREGIAVYLMARRPVDRTDQQSGAQTRLESRYNAAMANYLQ